MSAAKQVLQKYIEARGDDGSFLISGWIDETDAKTIMSAFDELDEHRAAIRKLREALEKIEWGRATGKAFDWATSEQLRDMARQAISETERFEVG